MNIVEEHISISGEELTLTNQRAIFWKRENALILSDLHVGKTAHFRRHGIPMPHDILEKDLQRLETLIQYFKADQLIVVGDLFHAEVNCDMDKFKTWLNSFNSLKLLLIKGNHDVRSRHFLEDLNIESVFQWVNAPFVFVHDSVDDSSDFFSISGHTHPGVLIKGKGRQKLKLPCYQVTQKQLILPAFSLFTGLNTHDSPKDAVHYAFTNSSIFKFK